MPPTEATVSPAFERILPRRIIKRRGTTRERTGCLTCRQRCRWEDPRVFGDNNTAVRSRPIAPVKYENDMFRLLRNPDPILFWVDEHSDCASSSSRRHFLRYYTQTFSILLTSNLENNCFLSAFLPMAMYSPPLLTCLVAWSSSHLSLRDTSFLQVATQNRCGALRDLRNALDSDSINVEITLAMSLVLCSLESIMADNGNAWYLHLVGAAGVISSKLNTPGLVGESEQISERVLAHFADAYTGRWLLRNFAYRDILMSVAQDRPPLLSSYHFLTLDEPRLPDSHFGLASEILEVLSYTSILKEKLKDLLSAPTIPGESDEGGFDDGQRSMRKFELIAEFVPLEARLIDWNCPFSTDTSLALLAESYRSSAMINLYRVMRWACPEREDELSTKTTGQVAAIVSSVAQMPTRSLPECTLLFPLFLAGGEATMESDIQSIRERMLDMIQSRSFRNVEVALSVLEKLWRTRMSGQSLERSMRIDWLDIVQRDEIYLSLS
ncbi:unnamed protein product [Penicillium glandicola]